MINCTVIIHDTMPLTSQKQRLTRNVCLFSCNGSCLHLLQKSLHDIDPLIRKQRQRIQTCLSIRQDETQNLVACWDRDGRKCCTECSSTYHQSADRVETVPRRRRRAERRRTPVRSSIVQWATTYTTVVFLAVFRCKKKLYKLLHYFPR